MEVQDLKRSPPEKRGTRGGRGMFGSIGIRAGEEASPTDGWLENSQQREQWKNWASVQQRWPLHGGSDPDGQLLVGSARLVECGVREMRQDGWLGSGSGNQELGAAITEVGCMEEC